MGDNVKVFVKKRGKNGDRKVLFTDADQLVNFGPFIKPNFEALNIHAIKFDVETKLENDELFYIELDDEHLHMVKTYADDIVSTAGMGIARSSDYPDMELIYAVWHDAQLNVEGITFQKIVPTMRVESKICLVLDVSPRVESHEACIEVSDRIDAYYDGERRIYFRDFAKLRCMFAGIDDFYRIASSEEVQKLTNSGYLDIINNVSPSKRSLKMIAILLDNGCLADTQYAERLNKSFDTYKGELGLEKNQDGKIVIESEIGLQNALSLMLGRCYTNEITSEKSIALQARSIG